MTNLAEAFIRIRPDSSRFGAELKSKTESTAASAGKETGSTFGKSMAGAIGAAFAAGAVVNFFKGAIAEAQEAAKVTKLTEAVIRSTGGAAKVSADQIGDLAERLSNLSGVDDEVIQSAENVLLTFTKVRNEAGKGNDVFNQGTEAALNLSAALGTDLQAATLLVGKALNDPIGGLTALKKAGIQLTDAQKDQIKSFVEVGDTMSAQKIILGELTTQFGGAAEAAASPADKARVAWGNFQEMVGAKLLPILNEILQFGLKNQAWLVPLAGSVGALAVVVGTVVVATKAWNAVNSVLGVGLEGTSAKAKRAALAASAVAIAASAIGHALSKDVNPQTDALADSLAEWGRTGKAAGEASRLFGNDLQDLNYDLKTVGSGGMRQVEVQFASLMEALGGEGPGSQSIGKAKERIGAYDAALAALVSNGHAQEAAAAFQRMAAEAGNAGISLDDLKAATPEYASALQLAARSGGILADQTNKAADAGQSLLDTWNELNGVMVTADEAVLDARRAIDGLAETFKEGGHSIDGLTLASSENRVELEHAAQKSVEAAIRYQENGHSAEDAAALLAKFRDEAIKATGATGKDRDAVKGLADELFRIPANVTTNVKVTVTGNSQLDHVLKTLDRMGAMADGGVLSYARGGIVKAFAGGGFEQHVAQIVKAGTWRVWGEDETGGEAYIPLATAKRGRSTAILADVAHRFGFSLVSTSDKPGAAPTVAGGSLQETNRLLETVVSQQAAIVSLLANAPRDTGTAVGAELNGSMGIAQVLGRSR